MKKKLKCFVCHKEINEEEDYVFKGQTVHKGECLKSMIDEYNAVRNLQIRNKRLCAEIERLNNIINELEKWLRSEIKRIEELQNPAKSKVKPYGEEYNNYTLIIGAYDNVLDKLQELKGEDKE